MKLNGRERVLNAVNFESKNERIPFTFAPCTSLLVHGEKLLKLFHKYQCNFFDSSDLQIPDRKELEKRLTYRDEWGCLWKSDTILYAGHVAEYPLEDWNNFSAYKVAKVPKVRQKDIDKANKTREKYSVWAGIDQFFQVMQNVRSSEKLFIDFYTQPEEVQKLIDRMLYEHHLPALEEQLKLKPDIVGTGDDWGTQTQLLINPELWDTFFRPVYRKMAELCHQGGAKLYFHTCGYTIDILERLIAAGVDLVNPQMAIMDAEKYGKIAVGKITVVPDLNRQGILVKGTPEEVKKHIVEMYQYLGSAKGGLIGYIPIEPDMPFANIEAMFETISDFKK